MKIQSNIGGLTSESAGAKKNTTTQQQPGQNTANPAPVIVKPPDINTVLRSGLRGIEIEKSFAYKTEADKALNTADKASAAPDLNVAGSASPLDDGGLKAQMQETFGNDIAAKLGVEDPTAKPATVTAEQNLKKGLVDAGALADGVRAGLAQRGLSPDLADRFFGHQDSGLAKQVLTQPTATTGFEGFSPALGASPNANPLNFRNRTEFNNSRASADDAGNANKSDSGGVVGAIKSAWEWLKSAVNGGSSSAGSITSDAAKGAAEAQTKGAGALAGASGTTSLARSATSQAAGEAVGTELGILTANTDSPDDKKNEFQGWGAFARMGNREGVSMGTGGMGNDDNAKALRDALNGRNQMPVDGKEHHDGLTAEDWAKIALKKGGLTDPVGPGTTERDYSKLINGMVTFAMRNVNPVTDGNRPDRSGPITPPANPVADPTSPDAGPGHLPVRPPKPGI